MAGLSADSLLEMVIFAHGEEYRAFPKSSGAGLLAWVIPPAALLLGLGLVVVALRKLRGPVGEVVEAGDMTEREQGLLDAAMAETRRDGGHRIMKGRTGASTALLATDAGVARVQAELRERGLDGWLLYDFKDRNPIGRSLLGLEWTTRRGFALIPASGPPRLLIHAIEHSSWRHLDWERESYSSRQGMEEGLCTMLAGYPRVAAETSARGDVPYLDLIPAGMRDVILDTGIELHSSGDLVSTFYAVWTPAQRGGAWSRLGAGEERGPGRLRPRGAPCSRRSAHHRGCARYVDPPRTGPAGCARAGRLHRRDRSQGGRPPLRPGRDRAADQGR